MEFEQRLGELRAEFAELEEPLQRYSLLVRLADYAPQPPCAFTTDEYLFRGCQTKVWLHVTGGQARPKVEITSDSLLLRGVGYVLMRLVDGLSAQALAEVSAPDLPELLGVDGLFSSRRQEGVEALFRELVQQAGRLPVDSTRP